MGHRTITETSQRKGKKKVGIQLHKFVIMGNENIFS